MNDDKDIISIYFEALHSKCCANVNMIFLTKEIVNVPIDDESILEKMKQFYISNVNIAILIILI